MRRDVEYVVGQLRRIGRALVAGSWSPSAEPITAMEAIAVIAEAAAIVADEGVKSVLAEGRRRMRELAARWDDGE